MGNPETNKAYLVSLMDWLVKSLILFLPGTLILGLLWKEDINVACFKPLALLLIYIFQLPTPEVQKDDNIYLYIEMTTFC